MKTPSLLPRVFLLLAVFSTPSGAERPAGNFGGHQQLDIVRLEKDLGKKFAIPFPSQRYDIDYFHKGDLVVRKNAEASVAATCPYALNQFITFAVGIGGTGEDYQMWSNVGIDLDDSGEVLRVTLQRSHQNKWPSQNISLTRKNDEKGENYWKRIERTWLASAESSEQPKSARNLVILALQLIRAVSKQNLTPK